MGNKVAIVTGASGNMGQAVVNKFLAEGYKVIGTVVPNDPVELGITHADFEKMSVNLTDATESLQLVSAVIKKYGAVDAAILTVGGFAMGTISETTTDDILKQYKLNFETAYNIARPAFLQMVKQGNGRLFMIGARPGIDAKSGKGMTAYGLAKSLLFRLVELMNEEAKGTNVVTSIVVPSTIDTPQNRKSMPGVDPNKWVTAQAIADVIFYHCTEAAAALREPVIKLYNNA